MSKEVLQLRIDGRVSGRFLGHRMMITRWKRLPYLTTEFRGHHT